MTWNYRVFAIKDGKEWYYYVDEAYYNKEGKVHSWSAEPYCGSPSGNSSEELRKSYEQIGMAFSKPVIYLSKNRKEIIEEGKFK